MNQIPFVRLEKIKKALTEQNLDKVLLTSFANIFYITNFLFRDPHKNESFVIVSKNKVEIFIPPMFQDQAVKTYNNIQVRILKHNQTLQSLLVKELKDKQVGFEDCSLSVSQYNALRRKSIKLIPLQKKFLALRQTKDKLELMKIRNAIKITDKTFEKVINKIRPGLTEKHIANLIKQIMENLGADNEAFPSIVASGKNSAIPHHQPTEKKIAINEIVLLDFGAKKDGYNADLTRTIFTGKPNTVFVRRYKAVRKAQNLLICKTTSGMTGKQIDRLTRDFFKKNQLEKYFIHSTGHGLGIENHEPPTLAPKAKQQVNIGSIVTIEPGLYFPGWGGIRIEDAVLMTKNGLKVMSKAPYIL